MANYPKAVYQSPFGGTLALDILELGHYQINLETYEKKFVPGPDDAGKVGIRLLLKNNSGDNIRRVTVAVTPLDMYGTPVSCIVEEKSTQTLTIGQTVPYDTEETCDFENLWFNHNIRNVRIEYLEVTYEEGDTVRYEGDGQMLEHADAQGNTDYTLTILRKRQFFLINPEIDVTLSDGQTFKIRNAETKQLKLLRGHYSVKFSYLFRKKTVKFDLNRDMTVVTGFSWFTGGIKGKVR